MTTKTTTFQDPQAGGPPSYRKVIERAKERAQPRPGPLENTPRFDQLDQGRMASPKAEDLAPRKPGASGLSDKTIQGLQGLGQVLEREAERKVAQEERAAKAPERAPVPEERAEAVAPDSEDAVRTALEARLRPLDIGQYLLSGGEMTQAIPIIPGKLEVRFRSVSEYEEGWVDVYIGKQKELTQRQFLRLMNECSLACYVDAINDSKWPPTCGRDGSVLPENMEERLGRVRKLPSAVFGLLVQNMGWFVERVNKALTAETLGNG